jgi:hypothetical protein
LTSSRTAKVLLGIPDCRDVEVESYFLRPQRQLA